MKAEAIAVEVDRLVDVCDEVPHSRLCHVRFLRFVLGRTAEVSLNSELSAALKGSSAVAEIHGRTSATRCSRRGARAALRDTRAEPVPEVAAVPLRPADARRRSRAIVPPR
jgi:hypothetical protein